MTRRPYPAWADMGPHDFAVLMAFALVRANAQGRCRLWLDRRCGRCRRPARSRFPARPFSVRAEEPWGYYGYRIVPDLMVFDRDGTVAACLEVRRAHGVDVGKRRRYEAMGMRLVEVTAQSVLAAAAAMASGEGEARLRVVQEALLNPARCPHCPARVR